MNLENENENRQTRETEHTLNIDGILATQPELGPSIPDGGYGWIIFAGTLFFQALIPCLIVNLGIFLAFSKLENWTASDKNVRLWDDQLFYFPLFYAISQQVFESTFRKLIWYSASPRLITIVGTCLTCAGLLFMWMGVTGFNDQWMYIPGGILSGLGSCVILIQCDGILQQYFRLKLPLLYHIYQWVNTMGFVIAPELLGYYMLTISVSHVLLWYQAIILQGLIVGLIFKKANHLKLKTIHKPYNFISTNPEDEEDIFSKNSRELQIKRQTSTETHISKIELNNKPGSSTSKHENWETFDEDNEEVEDVKYAKLNNWEMFDGDAEAQGETSRQQWEQFDDKEASPPSPQLVNTLSLAEEVKEMRPSPLFSDLPINHNNSYSYDDEIVTDTVNSNVFMPTTIDANENIKRWEFLKQPTFYKTLLTVTANTYSNFIFYVLFPSYLLIEADSVHFKQMTAIVGGLSITKFPFYILSFWLGVSGKKRPVCMWLFYWLSCVGYFMIADSTNEYVLFIGAGQIVFSIAALDNFTTFFIYRDPTKAVRSKENILISILSGLSLFIFIFIQPSFKDCFRLMAVLHFFTGTLWLSNFAFKMIRTRLNLT